MNERECYIYDVIRECEIATEDELSLVLAINGANEKTLNDVLFVRTGFRTIEQMFEEWYGEDE